MSVSVPIELPEGVFLKAGRYYRTKLVTNPLRRVREIDEATGEEIEYQEYDEVERPVVILNGQTDDQNDRTRREVAGEGVDVYHPVHGWLANGRKREKEWPENVGIDQEPRKRVRVRITPEKPAKRGARKTGSPSEPMLLDAEKG